MKEYHYIVNGAEVSVFSVPDKIWKDEHAHDKGCTNSADVQFHENRFQKFYEKRLNEYKNNSQLEEVKHINNGDGMDCHIFFDKSRFMATTVGYVISNK